MQLTPRTLGMALGACLVGGLILGLVLVLSPSVGATGSSPGAASQAPDYSQAELGDAQISYPTPVMTASTPTSSATSSPASPSNPSPVATSTTAPVSPSVLSMASPAASPTATVTGSQAVAVPNATYPAAPSNPKPTAIPVPRAKVNVPAVQSVVPQALHGWTPPRLGLGVTNISAPTLSSGARVHATVMCSPSTACNVGGNLLLITADAMHVSVTWNAPTVQSWRAWTTSSTFSPGE